jgi:large subunit ribosomal protein L25
MAPSLKLSAHVREITGKKSRTLRKAGALPAVLYGHESKSTPIALDAREFQTIYSRAGKTHLVDLALDGGRAVKVLVREVQTHPRRLGPVHVDLYRVNLRDKLHADVPIVITGEAPAVKRGDGDLLIALHTVRVECLPAEIPESFEVDVSGLEELDAGIRLGDLTVPEGVTLLTDTEELVVKVAPKKVAMEVAAEEAAEAEAAEAEAAAAAEAAGEVPAEAGAEAEGGGESPEAADEAGGE